ncbi:hypothetical protein PENARI_c056G11661 [Penicillium arizonense]|uniref:Carrier domain-containing protein n=1 Tax=Penicillium arizonense TaxID=1835702 RepID=A0A1F5L2C3_PENAI|nr:hypothetical protein PENARI_c056G11661 [Penicillium arizonense]OGE47196.1 hypothetical protein PENARI_c056G11661 [Penicillium arizonense]
MFSSVTLTEGALSHSESEQLINWNAIIPQRVDRCIHHIIQERCESQPNAPAVCSWDGSLTYGELELFSFLFASQLVAVGVKPGDYVPLCFDKCRWTVVAMLAVMKIGSAFTLLDPQHPLERLSTICSQLSATTIIVSPYRRDLGTKLAPTVIELDEFSFLGAPVELMDNSSYLVGADNIAFVLFTSGSTGQPKAVVISHSAFATGTACLSASMQLERTSRVLQFASYAFDVSTSDHLLTLLVGGCICVPSESERQTDLSEVMSNLQVNWVCLTPSVARIVPPERCPTLKTLVLGGEAISKVDIDMWGPHVQLIGIYGPSECAVASRVQPEFGPSTKPVNIGKKGCVACWVVDPQDHNRLVPIGAEGELLLQGPTISCGYLNDPERTAVAFVSKPQWATYVRPELGTRWYKTGDLVRYEDDGSLLYCGRKDMQVKLRGQRVELGEIEHLLWQYFNGASGILADVATLMGRTPVLVAFICCSVEKQRTSPCELFLQPTPEFHENAKAALYSLHQSLPSYMVPSFIMNITCIPRSPTGKADRRSLREAIGKLSVAQLREYCGQPPKIFPTSEKEQTLQQLWADVLLLPPENIGCCDSWTSLGGDSLSAMKLVSYARERGFRLSVLDIFRHPTVAELASLVRRTTDSQPDGADHCRQAKSDMTILERMRQVAAEQCSVGQEMVEDIYPCTEAQMWLIRMASQSSANYTLLLQFDLPDDVDCNRLSRGWDAAVKANPILRTRIIRSGENEYLQAVLRDGPPSDSPDSISEFKAERDIWGFGQPLVRIAASEGRCAVMMHHVLFDYYSLPLVFQQIDHGYRGHSIPLQRFRSYVQHTLQMDAQARDHWKNQFAGFSGKVYPCLPHQAYCPIENSRWQYKFPRPYTNSEFTLSTRLRLALAITMANSMGHDDIVFGAIVTGRGTPVRGIAELAGPTATFVPVRITLEKGVTLYRAMKLVQDQALEDLRFEHAGSSLISQVSTQAALACRYQTILIVQPDASSMFNGIFSQSHSLSGSEMLANFGLVLTCHPSRDNIQIDVKSDSNVIEKDEVLMFLQTFANAFHSLTEWPQKLISEVIG